MLEPAQFYSLDPPTEFILSRFRGGKSKGTGNGMVVTGFVLSGAPPYRGLAVRCPGGELDAIVLSQSSVQKVPPGDGLRGVMGMRGHGLDQPFP